MVRNGNRSHLASLAILAAAGCGGSYQPAAPPANAPAAAAEPPRVMAFDVRASPPAGGGFLHVSGSNFEATSAVTFGGIAATVTDFTPGAPGTGVGVLTVIVPPAALMPGAADAFADVVVWNHDGQTSTLAPPSSRDGTPWPANFHYGAAPVVSGFTPASGDGVEVTVTGSAFSAETVGARAGMRVTLSGPSVVTLQLPRCPDASEPACLAGVVSPTVTSVLATVPSGQLRPGEYVLSLMNFDGQVSRAPGTFVVP